MFICSRYIQIVTQENLPPFNEGFAEFGAVDFDDYNKEKILYYLQNFIM